MLILALVVVGAAAYFKLGVDRLPSVDLPTVTVRTTLPGASPEEMETEVSEIIEEAVNTVEGIDELRSISGTGQLDRHRDVQPRAATSTSPPRTCATASPTVSATCPTTSTRRSSPSSTTTPQPVLTLALSGERTLRELTELADKIVKVQLERSTGVGEVRDRRRARAGDQRLGRRRQARRLPASRSPPSATRSSRQNAEVPGGNVTGADAGAVAPHAWAGCTDAGAVQRHGRRDRQRRADPRQGHRPRRGRHQGAALASPGSTACPPVTLEIRRQTRREHRRGHRGRQGEARRASARSSRRT